MIILSNLTSYKNVRKRVIGIKTIVYMSNKPPTEIPYIEDAIGFKDAVIRYTDTLFETRNRYTTIGLCGILRNTNERLIHHLLKKHKIAENKDTIKNLLLLRDNAKPRFLEPFFNLHELTSRGIHTGKIFDENGVDAIVNFKRCLQEFIKVTDVFLSIIKS
jgi:hypothetical protein